MFFLVIKFLYQPSSYLIRSFQVLLFIKPVQRDHAVTAIQVF